MSFARLARERRTLTGEPIPMQTPEQLGLISAPSSVLPSAKARTVVQWIEGEFYQWEEFIARGSSTGEAVDSGQTGAQIAATLARGYLRLVQPDERFLGTDEAAVLLSASMLSQRPAPGPPQPEY
jgi:hypothetical protein